MRLVQLNQLDEESIKTVCSSFDNLPHTDHKDGKYRLRRYSRIELRTSHWNAGEQIEIIHLKESEFTQSAEYNRHQGGALRKFENLEDSTLSSLGFLEMCLAFKKENQLIDGVEVDVHQLRVVTLDELGGTAPVAPEGVHQDGYDCIAMVGIQRNNIEGGELKAYTSKNSKAILTYALKDGQMLFLSDKVMWHYATDIIAKDGLSQGYGDWFVLCANRL